MQQPVGVVHPHARPFTTVIRTSQQHDGLFSVIALQGGSYQSNTGPLQEIFSKEDSEARSTPRRCLDIVKLENSRIELVMVDSSVLVWHQHANTHTITHVLVRKDGTVKETKQDKLSPMVQDFSREISHSRI